MGTTIPFPVRPLSAMTRDRQGSTLVAGYLEQRLQSVDRDEGRKCRAMLAAYNRAMSGGNPLGIELVALRGKPREVYVFFRMPGIDRIRALPAIRLDATERLCEIVRVTAEVWRPAPLRTKTGNAPKRPGPPRKVVIAKVKPALIPGVRS